MKALEYIKEKATEHNLFILSMVLKGIDSAIETIGGVLLLFVNIETVRNAIYFLTQNEIQEDPRDLIANYLIKFANDFSVGMKLFGSAYLILHGAVKLFLILALFSKKAWAYPAAIAVFSVFAAYQTYRYFITYSAGLLILTVFDILVIFLIWVEYKNTMARKGKQAPSA